MKNENITLAHGNGGSESRSLVEDVIFKAFSNEILKKGEDAAIVDNGKLAMTTDSFTVSPLFFSGGDIGKLSICGTCNDLAMMGAKPTYLSVAFIIEEGFCLNEFKKIIESMQKEIAKNGAIVVCGDTKVVPKGNADKIFINTTGIGVVEYEGISASKLSSDVDIIVSRDIGTHGACIFASREGIGLSTDLKSDCESLYPQVKALLDEKINIIALRDATRGGLAAVLNEWATASNVCIELDEQAIPISQEVMGICELLGFEATSLANEGTFALAVPKSDTDKALNILKKFNTMASKIGRVEDSHRGKVIIKSAWGTKRFLELPTGELLPRIC